MPGLPKSRNEWRHEHTPPRPQTTPCTAGGRAASVSLAPFLAADFPSGTTGEYEYVTGVAALPPSERGHCPQSL